MTTGSRPLKITKQNQGQAANRSFGVFMLRIRLRRVGKKGSPSYRIVVADSAAPRDGAYVEWIGQYNPMVDPPAVVLKEDRAIAWLNQGAQPSDAVKRILDRDGIYEKLRSPQEEPVTVEEQIE